MVLHDFLSSGPALAAQEAQLAYIWTDMKSLSLIPTPQGCFPGVSVPFPAESWLQKQPCGGPSWMRQAASFKETPSVSGWLCVEASCSLDYFEPHAHQ